MHLKTVRRKFDSYGGEIIFTPGDIVYCPPRLELAPPKISSDKLLTLMRSEGITFDDLRKALSLFQGTKVHVLGDTIVDSYTYCTMIGSGTKTPTFSVKYENCVNFSGGAAVVAKHLRQAGADVRFSTVLGNDDLKDFVLKDLEAAGLKCDVIIDKTRPTHQKNAFMSGGYPLL